MKSSIVLQHIVRMANCNGENSRHRHIPTSVQPRFWRIVLAVFVFCFNPIVYCADSTINFNRDVRPILADNCFECHGPDAESREADLRLDTRDDFEASIIDGKLIVPGKPDESKLIQRLVTDDRNFVMPPPNAHRHPTKAQIETLRRWVAEGGNYREHWAFIPPERSPTPEINSVAWCKNPIDHFVLDSLQRNKLVPQPEAAAEILARRLSFALTGLPPSVEEIDAFEKAHHLSADQAVSEWVDRLLSSKHYGEHFAWPWMDAARYADTNGYQSDGHRNMWRWRDWLVTALNNNLPFDELTRRMLAGDLIVDERIRGWETGAFIRNEAATELVVATGFLRNHRYDTGSGTIPAESKFENAADRLETLSTVWLGLTLQCARCHDHKFDPLSSKDYYSLMAFVDKVPEYGSAMRGASHPFIYAPTADERSQLAVLDRKVEEADEALAKAEDEIRTSLVSWESDVRNSDDSTSDEPIRIPRGLRHRFAVPKLVMEGDDEEIHDEKPVSLITGRKPWTIAFSFRVNHDKDMAIFSAVEKPDSTWGGFTAELFDKKLRLRHVCRWVQSYIEFVTTESIVVGKTYHVAFASDGRGQGIAYQAFLDGDNDAMRLTHDVTNDNIDKPSKAKLKLGSSPFLPKFCGELNDLRFYDRRLSDDELTFLADTRTLSQLVDVAPETRSTVIAGQLRQFFFEQSAPDKLRVIWQRKVEAVAEREQFICRFPTVMVMQEGRAGQTHMHPRGAYERLGNPVSEAVPGILSLPDISPTNRLELAEWLVHPKHPLTARVAVNRLWQQLWGRGFIDTPENFGTQTGQPLHAELLDWLAVEYIESGWDTKKLIKLIVTSAAYRQRSSAPTELWANDPSNRLLARGPRYRLSIAAVRDSALFASNLLEQSIGGAPVLLDPLVGSNEEEQKDEEHGSKLNRHRRTLYSYWKRNAPHPMLAVFDVADRNQCDVRQRTTNTPLQALVVLNERGQIDAARAFADRIMQNSESIDGRLNWAYRTATGRRPDAAAMQILRDAISHHLTNVDVEHTAWTALANTLLNLDRSLTLE